MQRIAAPAHENGAAAASIAVLEQCARFLRTLHAEVYQEPSPVLAGSTIGQHVRHALDHFAAILAPGERDVIDYDRRERDTIIERDPRAAEQVIDGFVRSLEGAGCAAARVRVRVMLSSDGRESMLGSTIERELAFAMHHAIHHHAMIAAIARSLDLQVPDGFGIAPSTEHHRCHAERG